MKVFSYYEPLGLNDAEALLPIWTEAWSRAGAESEVLTPDAIPTGVRVEVSAWFRTYPTVNPARYELACYLRWIALQCTMRRRGVEDAVMVDLDVIPARALDASAKMQPRLEFLEDNFVPCAVALSLAGADVMVDMLMAGPVKATVGRRAHCSDMHICQERAAQHGASKIALTKEYGTEGWQDALLVHFATGACQGQSKAALMQQFLSATT